MTYSALLLAIVSIFTVFTARSARAQTFRGPISSALGGAGVAGLPAAEGSLLNPALVAIFPGSSIDATYRDGTYGEGRHRQALALGAIDDGQDDLFSGAVHYVRSRDAGRTPDPVEGELWHASIARRVTERAALGAQAFRQQHRSATGAFARQTQWNYGFGALVMISRSFGLGYVVRNLALPDGRTPRGLREDLQQTLGSYVGLGEMARLRIDIGRRERSNPDRQLTYAVGLESKTSNLFVFRLGFRHDEAGDGRRLTAGASFDGPRLKIDYALENGVAGADGALHSVDLRVPF